MFFCKINNTPIQLSTIFKKSSWEVVHSDEWEILRNLIGRFRRLEIKED